ESATVIFLGVLSFIIFVTCKDTYYVLPILLYTPFCFSRPFTATTIPNGLYIGGAIFVAGVIMHIILKKPRFKLGAFFYGLLALLIGMIMGGLLYKNDNYWLYLGLMTGISIVILFIYTYLAGTARHHSFSQLAAMMVILTFLLLAEMYAHEKLLHPDAMFSVKDIVLGWGCTNNIAMILLLSFPFAVYFAIKSNYLVSALGIIVLILGFIGIVLNYSRGGILAGSIVLIASLIYIFVKNKSKLLMLLYYTILAGLLFYLIVYLQSNFPTLIPGIMHNISQIHLDTFNGRFAIYEEMLNQSRSQIFFGYGVLHTTDPAITNYYLWGHNLYIQTLYTMGLFGIIGLSIHIVQKYYLILTDFNSKKMVVLLSFIGAAIYGMLDISYYYINFMIVLLVILVVMEWEVRGNRKNGQSGFLEEQNNGK
ncbi:MAG: O-antigen ligase family protein, partial [Bacilli bacterium]